MTNTPDTKKADHDLPFLYQLFNGLRAVKFKVKKATKLTLVAFFSRKLLN
ncbi:MAG: hypothetical protein ACJAUL_000118 [Paraglaciecola sp.]|jgi:hypothetical protein